MENIIRKFEVGKVYSCRSFCDHDTIYSWKVLNRTEKTITLEDTLLKTVFRRKVREYRGREACSIGNYSMAPVIFADEVYYQMSSKKYFSKKLKILLDICSDF